MIHLDVSEFEVTRYFEQFGTFHANSPRLYFGPEALILEVCRIKLDEGLLMS